MSGVQWPGNAYNPTGTDLSAPIKQLLKDMELLEERHHKDARGNVQELKATLWRGTPPGLQVISAGSLTISKAMAALVATVGGGGGAFAAVKGLFLESDRTLQATYVWAAAVCVAMSAVALSVIVGADVTARSRSMAAEYRARADVAAGLLNSLQYGRPAPIPPMYYVKRCRTAGQPPPRWQPVEGFEQDDETLLAIVGGEKLAGKDIAEWITYRELLQRQTAGA